jgi:mono/diheme cytochrome c family protein
MHYEYSVANGWVLVSPTLAYTNIGAGGDKTNGVAVWDAACAVCHGADGTTAPPGGTQSVGQFTRAKPYEAWFKIKFGEPGKMTPGLVTDTADMVDLYSALADATLFPNL